MFLLAYILVCYLIGFYMFGISGTNTGHGWPVKVAVGLFLSPVAVPIILFVNILLYRRQ
jgi:hypothetical protein